MPPSEPLCNAFVGCPPPSTEHLALVLLVGTTALVIHLSWRWARGKIEPD